MVLTFYAVDPGVRELREVFFRRWESALQAGSGYLAGDGAGGILGSAASVVRDAPFGSAGSGDCARVCRGDAPMRLPRTSPNSLPKLGCCKEGFCRNTKNNSTACVLISRFRDSNNIQQSPHLPTSRGTFPELFIDKLLLISFLMVKFVCPATFLRIIVSHRQCNQSYESPSERTACARSKFTR